MSLKKWRAFLVAGGITALVSTFLLLGGEEEISTDKITFLNMTISQKNSVVRDEIANAKDGDEIVSMRKANTKIHKREGNKFQAIVSTTPQHYLDEETQTYKDIDLTVHEVSAEARADPERLFNQYVNAGNYVVTWFDNKPWDYTFYKDDYYVKYEALFDTTGITIQTKSTNSGIKQDVILNGSTAANVLSWKIESNVAYEFDNGKIIFKDSGEDELFRMPALEAEDAKKNIVNLETNISNDTLFCVVAIPQDVVYPITVDPTILIVNDTDANTGWLYTESGTYLTARNSANAGIIDAATTVVGQTASFRINRSSLEFDTSALPDTAVIDSAKVVLTVAADTSVDDFVMHLIDGSWTGSFSVLWFNDFTDWAASGTYSITDMSDTITTNGISVGDSLRFKLTSAGVDSINISGVSRFMLLSTEDIIASEPPGNEFVQFEDDTPYFQIWYYEPPPEPTSFAVTDSSISSLTYSWTDESIDEDGFFIKNAADTTTVGRFAADVETGEVTGLSPFTSYEFYLVSFINGEGESDSTAHVTATTVFQYNHTYSDSLALSDFKTHKADINTTYATVRDVAAYGSVTTTVADSIGQYLDVNSKYHVLRLSMEVYDFLWANEMVSAYLQINLTDSLLNSDFELQVYEGEWTEPANEGTRYYLFDGREVSGAYSGVRLNDVWSTSSYAAGLLEVDFSATGLDTLESMSLASDTLRFAIISSKDSSSTAPTGAEYLELDTTNARIVYEWRRNSTKPTNFVMTVIDDDSISAVWDDNTLDETGFRIVDASDNSTYIDSTSANAESIRIGGLEVNSLNDWLVQVKGGQTADSLSNADSLYTLPVIMPAPMNTVTRSPTTTTHIIYIDTSGTGNPTYTRYAVQDSISAEYIHLVTGANDTLGAAVDWNILADWTDSITVTIDSVGSTHAWRVDAISGQ